MANLTHNSKPVTRHTLRNPFDIAPLLDATFDGLGEGEGSTHDDGVPPTWRADVWLDFSLGLQARAGEG